MNIAFIKIKTSLLGIILAIIIVVSVAIILQIIDRKTDDGVADNLKTILSLTQASMNKWLILNGNIAKYYANTEIIRKATFNLLENKRDMRGLRGGQEPMRRWFSEIKDKFGYLGYFLIDANGYNIASSRDSNLNTRSLLLNQEGLLKSVFTGNLVISHPIKSDVPLLLDGKLRENIYSIFAVVPVYGKNSEVVSAFALRMNPSAELAHFIDVATKDSSIKIIPVNQKFQRLHFRVDDAVEVKFPPHILTEATSLLKKNALTLRRPVLLSTEMHDDLIGAVIWDHDINMGLFAYIDSMFVHETYVQTKWTIYLFASIVFMLVWASLWNLDRSKARLQSTKIWLESLLNSIPLIISVVNEKGDLKFANNNLQAMNGFRNIITNSNQLYTIQTGSGFPYEQDLVLGDVWGPWCVKYISPKGDDHIVVFERIKIDDQDGIPVNLIVASDVTDYVGVELEKISLHRQLQQAQKMEAIGQLTGGIAHDFNNMLSAIMGYTQLSIDCFSNENEKLKEYLEEVSKAGSRAQNLVQQMLAYSRKENGLHQRVDPVNILNESLKLLKSTIPSSIEIIKKLPQETIDIFVDPVQLQQMIMNLVINSRDAINEKGVVICSVYEVFNENAYCSSCHKNFSGNYIAISVQDNGDGIAAERLTRIFEPFYTSKDIGKGSGMGLSMVHGIVHSVNGHIIVNSKPGFGTEVILLFPDATVKKNYVRQKTA